MKLLYVYSLENVLYVVFFNKTLKDYIICIKNMMVDIWLENIHIYKSNIVYNVFAMCRTR